MRTSDEKGKYRCFYKGCNAVCSYPDSLKRHIQTIHSENLFKCKYCNQSFRRTNILVTHLNKVHLKSGKDLGIYLCEVKDCRKVFDDEESLNKHEKIHPSKKYKCEKCNKEFGYRRNMLVHMKTAHFDKDFYKLFKCKFCNISCSSPSKLKKHLLSHTGERPYACAVKGCQKRYMCQSHLNLHLRLHHTHEKKHKNKQVVHFCKCAICGKIFKNSIFLKNHMSCHLIKKHKRTMNNIEKLKNNKCDNESETIKEQNNKIHDNKAIVEITKMNSSINNLSIEQKAQELMRSTNYNCTLCDKKCKTRRTFIFHQRFHAIQTLLKEMEIFDNQLKLTVYKCNICSKMSVHKSEHVAHLFTTHFTEQFYDCNVCNRVFVREDELSDHLKTHFDSDGNENEFSINQKILIEHENLNYTEKSISNLNLNKNSVKNDITKELSISIKRNKRIDKMGIMLKNSFKSISNPSSSLLLSPPIENVIKNRKNSKCKKLSVKLKKLNLDKIPLQQIKINRINIKSLLKNEEKTENTINDNNQQLLAVNCNHDENHINNESSASSQLKDSFDINEFVEVLIIETEEEHMIDTETNSKLVEPISFDINNEQNDQNSSNQMNEQYNNFEIETEIQINDNTGDDNLNDSIENQHIVIESQTSNKINVKEKNKNQIMNENVSHISPLRLLLESHADKVSINHQQEFNVKNKISIEPPQPQNKNQSDIYAKPSSSSSVKNLPSSEIVSSSNIPPLSFIQNEQIPIIEILDDESNKIHVKEKNKNQIMNENVSNISPLRLLLKSHVDKVSINHQQEFNVKNKISIEPPQPQNKNQSEIYAKPSSSSSVKNLPSSEIVSSSNISPLSFIQKEQIPIIEIFDDDDDDDDGLSNVETVTTQNSLSTEDNSKISAQFINWNEFEDKNKLVNYLKKRLSTLYSNLEEFNIPITFEDIIFLSTIDYMHELAKYDFSEMQLQLIRDIRRRSRKPLSRKRLEFEKEFSKMINQEISQQSSNTTFNLNNSNNITSYNNQQLLQPSANILNNNSSVAVVTTTPPTPAPLAVNCLYPLKISFQHPQNGYEITKEIPIQLSTTIPQYNQINTNLNLIQYPSFSSTQSSWSLPNLVPFVASTTEATISPINCTYILQQQQQQPFN